MAQLTDGFPTRIAFANDPSGGNLLFEKEVTPPGLSAEGEIDTTTMLNTTFRTKFPKSLVTLTEASFEAAYDPGTYTVLLAQLGVNQAITVTFPDASTYVFQGWLESFTPNALVEGEHPTATVVVMASNQIAGVETAPVFTP